MVATVASVNLLEQLDPFLLSNALLQYFFLRILLHKLAIEEDIMLASPMRHSRTTLSSSVWT